MQTCLARWFFVTSFACLDRRSTSGRFLLLAPVFKKEREAEQLPWQHGGGAEETLQQLQFTQAFHQPTDWRLHPPTPEDHPLPTQKVLTQGLTISRKPFKVSPAKICQTRPHPHFKHLSQRHAVVHPARSSSVLHTHAYLPTQPRWAREQYAPYADKHSWNVGFSSHKKAYTIKLHDKYFYSIHLAVYTLSIKQLRVQFHCKDRVDGVALKVDARDVTLRKWEVTQWHNPDDPRTYPHHVYGSKKSGSEAFLLRPHLPLWMSRVDPVSHACSIIRNTSRAAAGSGCPPYILLSPHRSVQHHVIAGISLHKLLLSQRHSINLKGDRHYISQWQTKKNKAFPHR